MSQSGLLKKAGSTLEELGIPYMLTGSLASSAQGIPRSTHDIDIVIEMREKDIDALLAAFQAPSHYLSRDAMVQACADHGMFNVIGLADGNKIDFWILTNEPFDRSRFARRVRALVEGIPLWVSTPEDTILMKLRWGKDSGGSRKQFQDAMHVYEVQHRSLDLPYVEKWAEALDLREEWNRLQSEASPLL